MKTNEKLLAREMATLCVGRTEQVKERVARHAQSPTTVTAYTTVLATLLLGPVTSMMGKDWAGCIVSA